MNNFDNYKPITIESGIVSIVDKFDLENTEYDTLVQMGIEVSETKIYSQWVLGRLADAVSNRYGDIRKYASEINHNYDALRQYMNTYRKFTREDPEFTPEKYRGSVPWGLLQLAASNSDSPQVLVDELHDKGAITIPQAYREIKIKRTGQDVPTKPKIKLQWNSQLKKYDLILKPEDIEKIDWSDIREQLMSFLETLT